MTAEQTGPAHLAARLEDRAHAAVDPWLRRRGWRPLVVPFTGYGGPGWVRVLARVLLAPPDVQTGEVTLGRGWRRFLTADAAGVPVQIEIGGRTHEATSARGGYVDSVFDSDLGPGWAEVRISAAGGQSAISRVCVVDPAARLGILSDIDDTVIVTALPRPLLAAWNTFVRHETSRRPVPGMAALYQQLRAAHPDAPFVYLSTGPWNVAQALEQFLDRHGYPPGPLLLTDWGPTTQGWFRSGQEHKRRSLRRLLEEFPQTDWLLIGDDGQHDPQLYAELAAEQPDRVRAIAIRQLSAAEQVRTHGTSEPLADGRIRAMDDLRAPDGFGLADQLRSRGLLGAG